MVSLFALHWRSLNRDRCFYAKLLLFVASLLALMLLYSIHLLHQDQQLVSAGKRLYQLLTLMAFVLLVVLQPYSHPLSIAHTEPYGAWLSATCRLLVSVLEAFVMMLVCLPLYALAAHTGGIPFRTFLGAGCLLLASVILTTSIRLNDSKHPQKAVGIAQILLVLLACAPYLLSQISALPRWVVHLLSFVSVPWVLVKHFSGTTQLSWLFTSLLYLSAGLLLVFRSALCASAREL